MQALDALTRDGVRSASPVELLRCLACVWASLCMYLESGCVRPIPDAMLDVVVRHTQPMLEQMLHMLLVHRTWGMTYVVSTLIRRSPPPKMGPVEVWTWIVHGLCTIIVPTAKDACLCNMMAELAPILEAGFCVIDAARPHIAALPEPDRIYLQRVCDEIISRVFEALVEWSRSR